MQKKLTKTELPDGYIEINNDRVREYLRILIDSLNLASIHVHSPYFNFYVPGVRKFTDCIDLRATSMCCCEINLILHDGILIGDIDADDSYNGTDMTVRNNGYNNLIFTCNGDSEPNLDFSCTCYVNTGILSDEMKRIFFGEFECEQDLREAIYSAIDELCYRATNGGRNPSILMPHAQVDGM